MSYGKVHDAYWESETIDALSDRAALLGLFLISGLHRSAIGCFKLGIGAITDNPRFGGWGIDGVSMALRELSDGGFITRDDRTGWTFIRNALKHDPIQGWKAAVHAMKLFAAVPKNLPFYNELQAKLSESIEAAKAVAKEWRDIHGYPFDSPSEAYRSPLPSPSPSPLPEPSPLPLPAVAPSSLKPKVAKVDLGEWEPQEQDRQYALDRGLDPQRIRDDIRAWAVNAAPVKRRKQDPSQFWQVWCRREADKLPPNKRPLPLPAAPLSANPEDGWKDVERRDRRGRIQAFRGEAPWHDFYGPKPGEPGCDWPKWLQDEELAKKQPLKAGAALADKLILKLVEAKVAAK